MTLQNPSSHLPSTTERVEVEYTFWNGPQLTVRRTITKRADILALVNAINSYPAETRADILGTAWPGGSADLRFIAPDEPERRVQIDASYSLVRVDDFPALHGNPWRFLVKAAPPGRGASGVVGMDWERCTPMLLAWGGVETFCYWPHEIDTAESRLPFVPVRPTDAIRHYTGLELSQVLLSTGAGPEREKQILAITYIFGSIPGDSSHIPDPAPPEPKFVIATEQLGGFDKSPRLDRTEYRVGNTASSEFKIVYGNWQFYATLPGDIRFLVTANLEKDAVEAIGQAITHPR